MLEAVVSRAVMSMVAPIDRIEAIDGGFAVFELQPHLADGLEYARSAAWVRCFWHCVCASAARRIRRHPHALGAGHGHQIGD